MQFSAPTKPYMLDQTDIGKTSAKLKWNINDPRPGPTNITIYVEQIVQSGPELNRTIELTSGRLMNMNMDIL